MAMDDKASGDAALAEAGPRFHPRHREGRSRRRAASATVVTRFPPEPNGYLHIGHAKSICLNFGVAEEFGGRCHLRFDDTNPTKEEQEYIDAIERDVRWLGFDWGEHLYHASDYFEQLYDWAEHLIRAGKAYVDDQTPGRDARQPRHADRARQEQPVPRPQRGGEPRSVPPHARRRISQRRARAARQDRHGARATSTCAIRCSTASCTPTHPRTGTAWKIYPSYDFAHGQSDAIEGITHSICTLEFEDHRPLYDWFIDNLPVPSRPRQYEFARLNLTYTVLSKRVLTELVRGGHVDRLGRSAHADAGGLAPARRAAGGDPRIRQAHRRRQGEQRGRRRHVRALPSARR